MNVKDISFTKSFILLTCLKLSDFFPRKSFVLQKFLPLNYTYGLWERLLSYNYYNSLLGATVVTSSSKRAKKKYIATADWSLQVCMFQNMVFWSEEKVQFSTKISTLITLKPPGFSLLRPLIAHYGSTFDVFGRSHRTPQPPSCIGRSSGCERLSVFSLSHISIFKSWQVCLLTS